MDIYWVHPSVRGKGLPGVKLLRKVEAEAKRRGVQRLYFGSKLHKDSSRLFQFMKMDPVEVYYSKWIGD
jgi:GNAT superfamily N-acetyltransferase